MCQQGSNRYANKINGFGLLGNRSVIVSYNLGNLRHKTVTAHEGLD